MIHTYISPFTTYRTIHKNCSKNKENFLFTDQFIT